MSCRRYDPFLSIGCNTLKIQYSTFGELTVKYNNAKTRDFINHDLPTGPDSNTLNGQMDTPFGNNLDTFSGGPPPAFPAMFLMTTR